MRVLFAMGSSQQSKTIADRYYDNFGETLEYKDVFYFKALLDEVKRDKSYNIIVINEELEQYKAKDIEQIDRKLFSFVDSITDEAQDADIVYICSDRRTKDDQFIVRLYSIGIYNILLGDDRKINSLCEIIKKPKTKREAKEYLNIDSGSINETGIMRDDEVDETQMLNILNYYDRIKDEPEKYVETFDRISTQYSRAQLKVIASWLPKNVQEAIYNEPKYKFLLSYDGGENPKSSQENAPNAKKVERKHSQDFFGVFKKGKEKRKNINHKNNEAEQQNLAEKARKEAAEKADKLEEEARKEAEEQQEIAKKVREEAEARLQQELAERAKKEAEERMQQELAERAKKEAELKAEQELAERDKKEAEERAKQEIAENGKKEAEERMQQELAEKAKKEAEERMQQELAEKAKKEAEERVQQELAEKDKKEAAEKMQQELAERAKKEAEERAKQELAEKAKKEAEDNSVIVEIDIEEDNKTKKQNENIIDTNIIVQNNISEEQKKFKEEQEKLAIEQEKIRKIQAELEEEKRRLREEQEKIATEKSQMEVVQVNNVAATYEMATVTPLNYKKIVAFVGANKAGTSFMVNSVAYKLAEQKILTSILDMTRDKSMYYIYNQSDKTLRKIAGECMQNLSNEEDTYMPVSKYLKVYTTIPGGIADSRRSYKHKSIIETVKNNCNVTIIDADFTTPIDYFENASEIYIVQDMDILKIQETTMFLREMKNRNMDMSKIKIIINKYIKNALTPKRIIEGLSYYKDPEMTFIDTLLNNKVMYSVIPYNLNNYIKYTESLYKGTMSFKGYSADFIEAITEVANQIYSKDGTYKKPKSGFWG